MKDQKKKKLRRKKIKRKEWDSIYAAHLAPLDANGEPEISHPPLALLEPNRRRAEEPEAKPESDPVAKEILARLGKTIPSADRGDSSEYVEFWNKYVLVYDFTPRLRLASIQPEDTRRCVSVERKEWVRVVESVSQLKPVNKADQTANRMGELWRYMEDRATPEENRHAARLEYESLLMKLSLEEVKEGLDGTLWQDVAPAAAIAFKRRDPRLFERLVEAIGKCKEPTPTPRRRKLDNLRDILLRHYAPTYARYDRRGRPAVIQSPPEGVFLGIFCDKTLEELFANLDIAESAFTEMRSKWGIRKLSRPIIDTVQIERSKETVQCKEYRMTRGGRKKLRKIRCVEEEQDVIYIFAGEFKIAERKRILDKLAAEKIKVRRLIIPPPRT